MNARQARSRAFWTLVAVHLLLTTGCSSKPATRYASAAVGSSCYAKALPSVGTGGLAWGSTLGVARKKSMTNCMRYAARSGGTPGTCQVVLAQCKN
ncbi:hypothetical protein TRP66_14670 [Pseudomonas sp. JDS28PS106]|uniref:hypothetical protein n=1 Tax=Pseudomonas sp. JDS28PS106 TaxID=2497235 RepID=UPI002FCF52F2